jgi:GDPmannose 4,6-dehydratase
MRTNSGGTHHVLAAVREHAPGCRLFLAGSSEMFGDVDRSPQNESTPMRPRGIYGISKLTAFLLMRNYREAHGLHASCGILYNHESPRRSEQFVTGKIVAAAVRIKAGIDKELRLGNLDSVRDWGDARDYVRAMWLMLQQPAPDDYVIATGQGRTIRDLLDAAFAAVELDWRDYVVKDERFYRPTEKCPMIGDATKARTRLGWAPKREFAAMVREMVAEKLTAYGLGTVRPS